MLEGKVRVLVVDDSPLVRQLIIDGLRTDPDVEVVGVAENGQQAIERALTLKPHVITMDVEMPVMDGLTATERIMAEDPRPILILTADPKNQAPELTHRALAVGALALRVKPANEEMASLAREVKLLATIRVIRHVRGVKKVVSGSHVSLPEVPQPFAASSLGLICIASSTGGPQVVQKLLASLPADFPIPIAIVQHINAAFSDSLLGWLSESSKLKVRVAKEGDLLAAGSVLLAPPDAHLLVAARGRVSLQKSGPREGHLPSATLLLESAAKVYGRRAVGVILTGMGNDGVDGIAAIRAAGGKTVAQNQESSVVFGMPGAAVAKGVIDHQVHSDDLADFFLRLARGQDVAKS